MTTEPKALSTPFVRFVSGTLALPPNSLYESANEVLARLREQSIEEVFKGLIQTGLIGGQHTVLPESTWYALFKDYLTYYSHEFSDSDGLEALLTESLAIMSVKPHEEAWEKLEEFLVRAIDDLSGWNKSWLKDDAEKRG